MPKPLRVVSYAVNGLGTGHVTRLIAISRWLRRHAEQRKIPIEIYFLTSTEAGSLLFAETFPYFKLPSRTAIAEARIDEGDFSKLAHDWVRQTLAHLHPDLFIVDTFPQGYFNELERLRDHCRKAAFIYRPLKESLASLREFQDALANYDSVLVPEYEQETALILSPNVRDRTVYIGPIIIRERDELLARDDARRVLGVASDRMVVYISMGGGGDPNAEREITKIYEALREVEGLHLVFGAGPLYRARPLYRDRLTWLSHGCAAELMAGFDVAVSAAGYNSFNELMHFGVPSLFVPQPKWADDQKARAERAFRAGAGIVLDPNAIGNELRKVIEGFRDATDRDRAAKCARNLVPRNHASDVAAAMLGLLPGDA